MKIFLVGVIAAVAVYALEPEGIEDKSSRIKRQFVTQHATWNTYSQPYFVTNETEKVPSPGIRYVIQQTPQFPFSFPFNWPFNLNLIPGISPILRPLNISKPPVVQPLEPISPQTTVIPSTTVPAALDPPFDSRKDFSSCGQAAVYSAVTARIVDGDPAQYGEFPWLVAIMRDNGKTQLCGGSLISSQYILSAAHCFAQYGLQDVRGLKVFIGDYNIYDATEVRHQVRTVVRLITHKKWNSPANFNDVALLKLNQPVQFNKYVQPICMARGTEATFYNSGTLATVAGWGKVQWGNGGALQSTPLKISVPLVDRTTCQNSIYPHAIGDSMVCAGAGYKSTCLGDSGGPLSVYSNGRWYQIGIVSWGLNCNGYGVYTRISSFQSWIDKYTKG